MASVAEAAKDPVLRRFALRKWTLQVGGRCLPLVIPDARDWIRRGQWTAERLRGGEPPYWVQVWPAATAMARHISRVVVASVEPCAGRNQANGPLDGMHVLDLGCGLGVPGCVSALYGGQVTFADRSPDALAFAAWNALQISGRPHRQQQLDWARQHTPGSFDLMLLADVSYHVDHHRPLLDQVASCLAPSGVVLHSDPFRPASARFLAELAKRMPIAQGDVMIRQGEQATRVRMVVASASAEALQAWSWSLVMKVESEERPSDGQTKSCGQHDDVRPLAGVTRPAPVSRGDRPTGGSSDGSM